MAASTTHTSSSTSFGPVKQFDAGLNVGHVDSGPSGGPALVLVHGWPYDIHSYVDVARMFSSEGYARWRVPRPPARSLAGGPHSAASSDADHHLARRRSDTRWRCIRYATAARRRAGLRNFPATASCPSRTSNRILTSKINDIQDGPTDAEPHSNTKPDVGPHNRTQPANSAGSHPTSALTPIATNAAPTAMVKTVTIIVARRTRRCQGPLVARSSSYEK